MGLPPTASWSTEQAMFSNIHPTSLGSVEAGSAFSPITLWRTSSRPRVTRSSGDRVIGMESARWMSSLEKPIVRSLVSIEVKPSTPTSSIVEPKTSM